MSLQNDVRTSTITNLQEAFPASSLIVPTKHGSLTTLANASISRLSTDSHTGRTIYGYQNYH